MVPDVPLEELADLLGQNLIAIRSHPESREPQLVRNAHAPVLRLWLIGHAMTLGRGVRTPVWRMRD